MSSALTNNYSLRTITVNQTLDTSQIDASLNLHQSLIDGLTNDGFAYTADLDQLNNRVSILEVDVSNIQSQISACGSYYKSTQQLSPTGSTDISFDVSENWTEPGYIDLSGGSGTNFVVAIGGIYRLDAFISCNANGQTWTAGSGKYFAIDITRSPDIERGILVSSTTIASGVGWSNQVSGLVKLQVGDIINVRQTISLTSAGNYQILGELAGTLDKNTMFQFQYIKP
jgi:hypothetical protein